MDLPTGFLLYAGIGFAAQLVDGALGMAYGVVTASLLLAFGLPPSLVSASVHAAEVAITGVSGVSHSLFGNIQWRLLRALAIPGVLGGVLGAFLLSRLHWGWLRPLVALYLLGLGVVLLRRAWRRKQGEASARGLVPLGLVAGFMDAVTGGGWGSLTTSTLVAQHHEPRFAIGTAHAAKFFVSLAISLVFLATIGFHHAQIVFGLMTGGVLAAPLGAWAVKRIQPRPLMLGVGLLVVGLAARTLLKSLGVL
jgi:uncharacterized membrane protein YfcA